MAAPTAIPDIDPYNFERNAFTNFAPLLTLFGDEPTRQFLSASLEFLDIIIIGIAPIGIMTIIVSAIRIAGNKFLKSLIGRSLDSEFEEEKELLPSTSSNVEEIWNGSRVVRRIGETKTKFFVFDPAWTPGSQTKVITRLESYSSSDLQLKYISGPRYWRGRGPGDISSFLKRGTTPSLCLSNRNTVPSALKKWAVLLIGLTVQLVVIFINALAVYKWNWQRAGKIVAGYGWPVWTMGTICLSLGFSMCAYVVISQTSVYHLELKVDEPSIYGQDSYELGTRRPEEKHIEILRVQPASDKDGLPAYLIQQNPREVTIRWPVTDRKKNPINIAFATCLTLIGFVSQNIGTRELHYSAGVFQLAATLVLVALRALLRRNIGNELRSRPEPLIGPTALAVASCLKRPSEYWTCRTLTDLVRVTKSAEQSRPLLGRSSVIVTVGCAAQDFHGLESLISSWIGLTDLHDEDHLKKLNKLADSLVTAMQTVFCAVVDDNSVQPSQWSHLMEFDNRATKNPQRQLWLVPLKFTQILDSKDTRDSLMSVIAWSSLSSPRGLHESGTVQVVGSFLETEVKAKANQLHSLLGLPTNVWDPYMIERRGASRFFDPNHNENYEIIGCRFNHMFSDLTRDTSYVFEGVGQHITFSERKIDPHYLDVLVDCECNDTSEEARDQFTAMELFISFFNQMAITNKAALTYFVSREGAVDWIAETLRFQGICREHQQGRLAVISVLLLHDIDFFEWRAVVTGQAMAAFSSPSSTKGNFEPWKPSSSSDTEEELELYESAVEGD